MPSLSRVSFYIPSAGDIDRAAKIAIENIEKQLKKLPPVKKPASAADNFPGIYDNPFAFLPHVIGQSDSLNLMLKRLKMDSALRTYRNAC